MFGDKKLKREVAKLEDEKNELMLRCKSWQEEATMAARELSRLGERVTNAEKQLAVIDGNYTAMQREVSEANAKVRVQNEADLMFVSVKIISELLKDKKLKDVASLTENLSAYARAYNMAQQQQGNVSGLGELIQGLGL